jgi:preprotein translocase subunit SecY
MAKQLGMRSSTNDLKKRTLFVICALIVFRIGSFIPIPGINTSILARIIEQQHGTLAEMFNTFSGGALSRASIFALGIMPYVSASIIIQLLTLFNPTLAELKKEGELGRRRINQYTRYGTLLVAILQSVGIATGLPNIPGMQGLVVQPGFLFYSTAILSLVTGTMFLMWLGEQITERGLGNGISIIIFSGIVAGLPPAFSYTIEQARQGRLHFSSLILIVALVFSVTFFVVFIERGQRKIQVNYAQRQQGRRLYTSQSTHLPLKINMAGVIPAIFASSVMLLPGTIVSWFGTSKGIGWLSTVAMYLQPGQPVYVVLYTSTIIFFCFFYTTLLFNPRETAVNLKKSGAFIPGIRPGEQTAKSIHKIINRLTLIGSFYIAFICLIPEFIRSELGAPFCFGGTSLLIVVVVVIEFMAQVQTMLMSSQYDSVLKKANLKS